MDGDNKNSVTEKGNRGRMREIVGGTREQFQGSRVGIRKVIKRSKDEICKKREGMEKVV